MFLYYKLTKYSERDSNPHGHTAQQIFLLHLLLYKQTNIYLHFQAPRLIFVRHCEAILTDIKKSSFIYSPDG